MELDQNLLFDNTYKKLVCFIRMVKKRARGAEERLKNCS